MGKEKKNILIIVFLVFTIFLSGFLYKDSFNAYFFQDDWFTLRISQAKNISELLNFFVPRTDVIYYRPLGMQVPFFILRSIFGINPLPFHLLTFFTHALNILLVFFLIKLISKNIFVAAVSSFLYGTSAIHFTPFFWSSTYSFVLGPTFFFTSFIFFLRRKVKLSFLYYICGILTNEIVMILPFVLLMHELIYKRRKNFFKLPFFYLLAGLLIFLPRLFIFPPPIAGYYKIEFGSYLINNLKAYFLWSFNWPEEMKAQFINFFVINSQFLKEFSNYMIIFGSGLMINLALFYIFPIGLIIYKKNKKLFDTLQFGIIWFFIGLLPILFFSQHSFSYYLPISLVGLLLLSTTLLEYLLTLFVNISKGAAMIVLFLICISWLTTTIATIEFNSKIHWAPRRARISKDLVTRVQKIYPRDNPDYPFIYIQPSSEKKLALNDQDGLKIIYGDENIITLYKHMIKKQIL